MAKIQPFQIMVKYLPLLHPWVTPEEGPGSKLFQTAPVAYQIEGNDAYNMQTNISSLFPYSTQAPNPTN